MPQDTGLGTDLAVEVLLLLLLLVVVLVVAIVYWNESAGAVSRYLA